MQRADSLNLGQIVARACLHTEVSAVAMCFECNAKCSNGLAIQRNAWELV